MASSEIFDDITTQFEQQAKAGEYDAQLDTFMNEVVAVWKDNSPVGDPATDPHPGEYRDSVQVTKPAQGGKGQVGATVEAAPFIEYGTERSPEYAVRARTEAHFERGSL